MNSAQRSMANHASIYAWLLTLLAFVLLIVLTLFILASNEIQNSIESSNLAVAEGDKIIDEATTTLLAAEQRIPADCTPDSLAALRRLQFRTQSIGDIGILDDQGRLLCSSFLGLLKTPYPATSMDVVLQQKEQLFGYLYQHPVLIGDNRVDALIMYHGRYNVVIKPGSFSKIMQGEIGLLRSRTPDGRLLTIFENLRVPYPVRQKLFNETYSTQTNHAVDSLYFDPNNFSVVLTHTPDAPHTYYFISNINLLEKLKANQQTLWLLSMLYLFVAFLIYRLLTDKFSTWAQIGYRIHELLDPSFIRCYYQPIINLATDRVIGAEVLMRINDNGKLLYPDSFFPEVIKQHLQGTLDQAVVDVLEEELKTQPLPADIVKLGINFFPETISSGRAREIINKFISSSEKDFTLNLEILEQDFHGTLIDEIEAIRTQGVTVSIDDFGTGYSNLGSIKDISPDYLKIDRSFIQAIDTTSIRSSLLPEIVNIARAVNAKIVAEGIEEAEQVPVLCELGVEYVQGYYFARPMTLVQLCEFIEKYNQDKRILKSA